MWIVEKLKKKIIQSHSQLFHAPQWTATIQQIAFIEKEKEKEINKKRQKESKKERKINRNRDK